MGKKHKSKEFDKLLKLARLEKFSIIEKGNQKYFVISPCGEKSYLFHKGDQGVKPFEAFINKCKIK